MNRWFRWYEGTTEDGKFRAIARNAGVTVATVTGVWAALLEDASHNDPRGVATRGSRYWAAVLELDDTLLSTILADMQALNLITISDNITITHWKKRQFETDVGDKTNAKRQKRYRNGTRPLRDRLRNGDVTVGKRPDTETDTETDTDTELASSSSEEDARDARAREDFFSRFQAAYPEREGGSNWEAAHEAFDRAVEDGAEPEAIIAGAAGYAEVQARQGNAGTRYIAAAARWLDDKRWTETQPAAPRLTPEERDRFMAAKGYTWNGAKWEREERTGNGSKRGRDAP